MPTYEYMCDTCDVVFEEILIDPDDVKKYQNSHPCCNCDSIARRILSSTNFQFGGTPGNSGSHDLDYPVLDKAIGRSAAQKWEKIHEGKQVRDKVRKESGQHAVTQIDGVVTPTSKDKLKIREHAIKIFNEVKK